MIESDSRQHGALYDELGNIVLVDVSTEPQKIPAAQDTHETSPNEEILVNESSERISEPVIALDWEPLRMDVLEANLQEDEGENDLPTTQRASPALMQIAASWTTVRSQVQSITNSALQEGEQQWRSAVMDSSRGSASVRHSCAEAAKRLHKVLTQPVVITRKNKAPKHYGRGRLFLYDVVRFGGTFAGLFVVLFSVLNYQSFWAIAQSYVDPLSDVALGRPSATISMVDAVEPHADAERETIGLLAALPDVGPPDRRLVIPRLNINVPIVLPSAEALVQENWAQLEKDIQESLQDGVVHYPGTAQPGQAGNFFITGHSSYFPWAPGKYKSVFARLHELAIGDEYWVYYNGDKHRYVIRNKREIKPTDVSVLDQPVNRRISTLMTCTPVGTSLRRLIITAQEVDPLTGEDLAVGERTHEQTLPSLQMEMLPI